MKYFGLDWIGTILGLASIHYLGRKNKTGFILRIVASAFWVAFGILVDPSLPHLGLRIFCHSILGDTPLTPIR